MVGKGIENGHAAGEIDEATLRRGEAKYTHYFQERRFIPTEASALPASFL